MRRYVIPIHQRAKRKFTARNLTGTLSSKKHTPRSEIWPDMDDGYCAGASTLIDEPRQPQIAETGILDARGVPLVRVTFPVKVKMGFHPPKPSEDIPETVGVVIPADMLSVTETPGGGMGYVDLSEVESEDEQKCDCEECRRG